MNISPVPVSPKMDKLVVSGWVGANFNLVANFTATFVRESSGLVERARAEDAERLRGLERQLAAADPNVAEFKVISRAHPLQQVGGEAVFPHKLHVSVDPSSVELVEVLNLPLDLPEGPPGAGETAGRS